MKETAVCEETAGDATPTDGGESRNIIIFRDCITVDDSTRGRRKCFIFFSFFLLAVTIHKTSDDKLNYHWNNVPGKRRRAGSLVCTRGSTDAFDDCSMRV